MARYRDLKVWHRSMDLTCAIYNLISVFPKEEKYALADQMRRAAVSIPSNIAEGHSRGSEAEFKHFLSIASGSLAELQTQVELARRFGYITEEQLKSVLSLSYEVSKMIWALQRNIVIK